MELEHVDKTFIMNGVTACRDVCIAVGAGELLVLMGENGAGKSTLASLMGGILTPDKGLIRFPEKGPAALVHQKPSFSRGLSVSDMVFGGNSVVGRGFFYSRKKESDMLDKTLRRLGASFHSGMTMGELVPYQHQMAELAESLLEERDVIILDEPEFPRLPEILDYLRDSDVTPVLITHRIQDAMEYGDRIIVMSKGRIVLDRKRGDPGLKDEILKALMGSKSQSPAVGGNREEADKSGVIRVIAGYHESGLWDEEIRLADRFRDGENGYIPSVNRQKAMESSWSPVDNLMIHSRKKYRNPMGFLKKRNYMDDGYRFLDTYGIVARPQDLMAHLSGGNQKKLLLLREFQRPGKTILLSEPSTALDLANRAFLHDLMKKAKAEGKEVILLTADPEEALALGDVITPLFKGKMGRTIKKGEATLAGLTALMGGMEHEKHI